MDRLLRPFGLPGHSFVPLLSSHACALPGIMATRAIPDRKQRLATILVAPFMTCSARLPVYVLLTSLLFANRPALAALAFVGCYVLGIVAGVLSALIARRTILRGKSRPMAMELPCYKKPSVRTAVLTTVDRAKVFLKNAGTNILMICIVLWWLGAYPKVEPDLSGAAILQRQAALTREWPILGFDYREEPSLKPSSRGIEERDSCASRLRQIADTIDPYRSNRDDTVLFLRAEADRIERIPATDEERERRAAEIEASINRLEARNQATHSFLGRIGRTIQPVFEPLGYDWQLSIGVLASFAAREVFVSTMSIVVSGQEDEGESLFHNLATATRDDGITPIFTRPTAWSLLVYYVLAMQCLPTLAVTAREAGGRRWALLQLAWMCGMAYLLAMVAYRLAS
jgi:ferrous iron transport protein B